jgi:glutathione S-transferase
MTEWISLQEAMATNGVRLVLARFGIPSPWSEFCRAIFDVKKIPYQRVDARDAQGTYRSLLPLTAQESVPVVLIDAERPRSYWLEQVYAAERLASQPPLIPPDSATRSLVIGLVAELCAEGGFGWCRRLQMIERLQDDNASGRDKQIGAYLAEKYGMSFRIEARSRCETIVSLLAERLRNQHATGRSLFIGDHITALDLAWAAFAALIKPLPESDCPMPPRWRDLYTWTPSSIDSDSLALLLTHRDQMYRESMTLPVPTL